MNELDTLAFKQLRCPSCGLTDVEVSLFRERFKYGDEREPDKQVELNTIVLVQHCKSCDTTWTDEAASAARDATVTIHLMERTLTNIETLLTDHLTGRTPTDTKG